MRHSFFRIGKHLTLKNEEYLIERTFEDGRIRLERVADAEMLMTSTKELSGFFVEGSLKFTPEVGAAVGKKPCSNRMEVDLAALSKTEQTFIKRRFAYVFEADKLLADQGPCRKGLSPIIESVHEKQEGQRPSVSSVYRWWKRWLLSDKNLMSLRSVSGKGRRKTSFEQPVIDCFSDVVDRVYMTREKNPVSVVYQEFKDRLEELNETLKRKLRYPSESHFYRLIAQLDQYEVCRAREGDASAKRKFRSSGAGPDIRWVLERVEVDHTALDVMVVNEQTGVVDGRPWLTLLLDYKSKMPLGLYIGFEPPSELSVMFAFQQAILPKDKVLKAFSDVEGEWLAQGIPMQLVCDNGLEFHSHNLRRMCLELNVEILFCPKKEPHYKGSVERFLGTLNTAVCHRLPGTTFSNIKNRGDYDPQECARVTLSELQGLIYQWIVDIYQDSFHRSLKAAPAKVWSKGMDLVEPRLPESVEALELIVSKEILAPRTLSGKGVVVNYLFYNSPDLDTIRYRESDGTAKVRVRYNPLDASKIYVLDESSMQFIVVPSIYPEYTHGLTHRQHNQILKHLNMKGKKDINERKLRKARLKFYGKLQELSQSKKITDRRRAARDAQDSKGKPVCLDQQLIGRDKDKSVAPIIYEDFEFQDLEGGDVEEVCHV